jgi:hypothetical protein
MVVEEDGTYKASTTRGTLTEGMFYLRDGKLRYRSTRTTGTASLSEGQGKTILTMMPWTLLPTPAEQNTNESSSETSVV